MKCFESDPEGWLKDTIVNPEKELAFFVGAGISRDSGLPDFFEFSSEFIRSICPIDLDKNTTDEICNRLRPEVLLQVIYQVHKDRILDFYKSLNSNLPNANHFFLALALSRGHCIFTTNVDTLIEQACRILKVPCNPIINEKQYRVFIEKQSKNTSGINFRSQLFKLHGSIGRSMKDELIQRIIPDELDIAKLKTKKYKSIRFTLDRVGLGLTDNQERVLSECLRDRDFVFLGYSGNDHFSVHPLLLKVNSDQIIYWLKFQKDQFLLNYIKDIGYLRSLKKELLDKALDGTSLVVKWEDISILEVLSKRENSYLIKGESSWIINNLLEQIISTSPDPTIIKIPKYLDELPKGKTPKPQFYIPRWVKDITTFERHICAAKLFLTMRDLNRIDIQLKCAQDYARYDREKAEVEKLRAMKFSLTRQLGIIKSSEEDLLNALHRFEQQRDFIGIIESYLELSNIKRIDRSYNYFEYCNEMLDKAEKELIKNKSKFQEQNRAYDWPRLMAYLFHQRGLILGQKGTITDKLDAIFYCEEAYDLAYQAGDITRRAAALNARGLFIYQLAEKSGGLLQEAEISLDNALALYSRIGDPRSSFQPSRNRLLINRLRSNKSRLYARDHWLSEMEKDCNRSRNYLTQVGLSDDEPSRDMIEVDYRQAQLFGFKGNKIEACTLFRKVLIYWEKKNDLHQQARIWQDLLSLADDWEEDQDCLRHLLAIIRSLLQSENERKGYKNDLVRLENIRDMLIDAYVKAYEYKDLDCLSKIVALMDQGKKIADDLGEEYLSQDFKIWSSEHPE